MARMTFQNLRLRASPGAFASRPFAAPAPVRRRRARLLAHEVRALLGLAVPLVVSQLGGVAMNVTDVLMVAPLGPEALASAAVATSVHMVFLVASTGALMGITPLVSQAFGAGERDDCRRTLVQGAWLALLLAIPATVVSLLGRPLALLLGQDPAVAATAGSYLAALAPGLLPLVLFAALRSSAEGQGVTRPAMLILFAGVAVNAAGNLALIHGVPGVVRPMGVVGSAVATSVVRWMVFLAMAIYVLRHADLSPLRRVSLRPAWARMRRIVEIGSPIGAQLAAEIGIFSLAAVMMGWLGPVQLAAHQVTINLASSTFMVAVGTSIAGSIRVGHHIGAGNTRAVRRAALATYLLTLGFMALCALLFLAIPERLIGLYTTDAQIVRYGTALLFMAALFQLFDGAQVASLSLLRGAADTRVPMGITLLGYWGVGLPVAYLLGFHTPMRHLGIWSGLVVSLGVVSVLLAWRVRRVLWERPLARAAAPAIVPEPHVLEGMEGALVAGD